jgi:WD40 repeat protein
MNERRVKELLRDDGIPKARQAEERGWRVVRAAFEARHPVRAPRRLSRLVVALVAGVLILAVALSPAGAKVAHLVHDVVQPGDRSAQPALTSLPAPGRLLVTSPRGPWVVNQDGSKRLVGAYEDAAWSPHGLYVAATRGRELTAVEPTGTVHWSLAARRMVSNPAWSTSGVRVAYLSGSSLRIAAGDGTEDHQLAKHVAPVTPAWRPLRQPLPAGQVATGPRTNVLAYADRRGRVTVRDVDSGRLLMRSVPGPTPIELSWSSDGKRLLSVARHAFWTFNAGYRHPVTASPTYPWTIRAASFRPGTHRVAAVETRGDSPATARSVVLLGRTDSKGFLSRQLFAGPGLFDGLAWSPDGRWLLVGWEDADQWLFLRASGGKVRAFSRISRQFDPGATGEPFFPRISGWCCTR